MSLDTSLSTNHPSDPVSTQIEPQSQSRPRRPASSTPAEPQLAQPWVCRFFNTNKGCRAGSQCPFRHVSAKETAPDARRNFGHQQLLSPDASTLSEQSVLPNRAGARISRLVPNQKPVSQFQQTNPREFQLGQIGKRYSPIRTDNENGTLLSFVLVPSDPDFPFDLEGGLYCELKIPAGYPHNDRAALRVTNAQMPRGFQINVEKGFDSLVDASPQKTLLALLNDLDRNLERFLSTEKAQTIKIISNADKTSKIPEPVEDLAPPSPPPETRATTVPVWSTQQRLDALAKRQADTRQLEARMSRVPGFTSTSDGTSFHVPVQITKSSRLHLNLQAVRDVTLLVPKLYNLEPCTVLLNGVDGPEAENVQLAFEKHAQEKSNMSLTAHINYLTQNIHAMAATESVPKAVAAVRGPIAAGMRAPPTAPDEGDQTIEGVVDEERPHLHFVPRPPEWDTHDSESGSDESSYDSADYTETDGEGQDDAEDEEGGGASLPASAVSSAGENGIHLSFPNLELHNIELLILESLSLSVKCLRCKTPSDVSKIKASPESQGPKASVTRHESCSKCTTPFTFSFSASALHANTIRAGAIEATGCTISDMLPSVFQPTCSSCSTIFPTPPGMISVRGDTPIQICRSCHAKMTFTIHEVKLLRVSHHSATLPLRRPKKENLGISAGTPLPNNGTCAHYRHSYRWFRFSCCNRVHACDRCHDAAEEHVNERAERMVCGWCSREQRFRSEDCGVCGRSVMRRKKVGGFWEGGQGTRDRRLMRRGEKRKYKRVGGKEAATTKQGKKKSED